MKSYKSLLSSFFDGKSNMQSIKRDAIYLRISDLACLCMNIIETLDNVTSCSCQLVNIIATWYIDEQIISN